MNEAAPKPQTPPLKMRFLVGVAACYVRFAMRTSRIRIEGTENEDLAHAGGRPLIYSIWHSRLLIPIYTHRNRDIHAMVSQSRDGELITRFAGRFGYGTVRGSSSRGGVRALVGMKRIVEHGLDTAFTPDGPRGPRQQVQGGVIALARIAGAPIVPAGIACSHCFELKSWDRFVVPKPFGRIAVTIGEPMRVDADADADAARIELQARMDTLHERAEDMLADW